MLPFEKTENQSSGFQTFAPLRTLLLWSNAPPNFFFFLLFSVWWKLFDCLFGMKQHQLMPPTYKEKKNPLFIWYTIPTLSGMISKTRMVRRLLIWQSWDISFWKKGYFFCLLPWFPSSSTSQCPAGGSTGKSALIDGGPRSIAHLCCEFQHNTFATATQKP